jgi:hypothetical protein
MKRINRSKYCVCWYLADKDFVPFPLNSSAFLCLLVPIPVLIFETNNRQQPTTSSLGVGFPDGRTSIGRNSISAL